MKIFSDLFGLKNRDRRQLLFIKLLRVWHYLRYRRLILEAGLFDPEFYLRHYPDIASATVNPLRHYMLHGGFEGRNPGEKFNSAFYLKNNQDVADASINPLVHYFLYGCKENRLPLPDFSPFTPISRYQYLKDKQIALKEFLSNHRVLEFQEVEPVVSIILVLYNQAEFTLACLQSVLQYAGLPVEVIIVDNHSADETSLLLDRVTGAKIIHNEENKHFLAACNQALDLVNGEFVLFLNNDAVLLKGTLAAALETFRRYPDTGAVGGKIVLPSGTLQEAGSIIWQDGSCTGYGRGELPGDFAFNFYRVVDYCSGALLMTPTSLLKSYGGFDTLFSPAYYEETDYCLRLQENGKKVVYNPTVVIRHFEFGSSGFTDATAIQKTNREKFYQKHKQQLQKHRLAAPSNLLTARFAISEANKPKILVVDDRVPHQDQGSGNPRSNTIIRCLVELGFQVTIFPNTFPDGESFDEIYRDIDPFVEVACGIGHTNFEKFIAQRKNYYDFIWVSRPHNMLYLSGALTALKGQVPVIYDSEAINVEREYLKGRLSGNIISEENFSTRMAQEIGLCEIADAVIAVSDRDASKFKSRGIKQVYVLGHTLEKQEWPPTFNERSGLLFVGNLDHDESPNTDSVLWFAKDILPLIRRRIPDIEFHIVGSNNASSIKTLSGDGIFVHGRVSDLSEIYNRCRVFVAPTRFAAGIPYKIHEAASYGIPMVVTDILREQLQWEDHIHLVSAPPDSAAIAENVAELYTDETLWKFVQQNSLDKITTEHSYNAYRSHLQLIFELIKKKRNVNGMLKTISGHQLSGWAHKGLSKKGPLHFTIFLDSKLVHTCEVDPPSESVTGIGSHPYTIPFQISLPGEIEYKGQQLSVRLNQGIMSSGYSRLIREESPPFVGKIKVFGERASATNFLEQLLKVNFPNTPHSTTAGWKHSFPIIPGDELENCLYIVIFRNPYDWLRSYYLQPHHVHPDLKMLPFSQFIRSEWHCIYDESASIKKGDPRYGTEIMKERNPLTGERFRNILELRNAKCKAWLDLKSTITHCEFIKYEDLTESPETFISYLREKYNLPSMPDFQNVLTYKGITNIPFTPKTYFEISAEDYTFINLTLDVETEKRVGYNLSIIQP